MVYWVFGYGSLIFKPPPHTVEQKHPGRVVTVVEAKAWHALEGIELKDEKAEEVKAYMEYREKHGYTCHLVPVYTRSADGKDEIITVESSTIWIGKPEDPAFVGYEPLDTLAKTILVKEGSSGSNKDYLFKLAESVRHLYPHVKDDYLFNLERAVRELDITQG
ncbi:uncharacterized protein IAS62_001533 [Cryptococcus decagattii]|uniref:glutathione-specific gamma-glutamylcyclotransferase n=1 Tax=Cryptococcus decagattii TaxID=1859122 RepID=A0ABZ2ANY8_9TREE